MRVPYNLSKTIFEREMNQNPPKELQTHLIEELRSKIDLKSMTLKSLTENFGHYLRSNHLNTFDELYFKWLEDKGFKQPLDIAA